MLDFLNYAHSSVEAKYELGITLITLAFVRLFYLMTFSKAAYKIPKSFLLLYALGGLSLIFKNIEDQHLYITINEAIGCAIAFMLYLR